MLLDELAKEWMREQMEDGEDALAQLGEANSKSEGEESEDREEM